MKIDQKKDPLSILRYFGGKYYYLNHLFPFPSHQSYYEPFLGSGVVFLNKHPSTPSFLNDGYKPLMLFFQAIKDDYKKVQASCLPYSRCDKRQFQEVITICEHPDDYVIEEVAAAFLCLNSFSFSGGNASWKGNVYNPKRSRHALFGVQLSKLGAISRSLQRAELTALPFEEFFASIPDRRDVFVYCDPPYYHGGKRYARAKGFTEGTWSQSDFDTLWAMIDAFQKTKFTISIDKHHSEILAGDQWHSDPFSRNQFFGAKKGRTNVKKSTEFVIRNWSPTSLFSFL